MAVLGKSMAFLRRALAARGRRGLDAELDEEMRQHLELRTQALIGEGMTAEEARFEARRRFGNAAVLRQDAREVWSFRPLEQLAQDVRFGARLLVRTPLVTATAVVCLATG